MHGGLFPVHSGHREGDIIDGYHPGYNNMNAAAAQWMLAFVEANRTRIDRVFVAFSTVRRASGGCGGGNVAPTSTNDYWNVIKDTVLSDGRPARSVILNDSGHCTHFDVKVRPPGGGQ